MIRPRETHCPAQTMWAVSVGLGPANRAHVRGWAWCLYTPDSSGFGLARHSLLVPLPFSFACRSTISISKSSDFSLSKWSYGEHAIYLYLYRDWCVKLWWACYVYLYRDWCVIRLDTNSTHKMLKRNFSHGVANRQSLVLLSLFFPSKGTYVVRAFGASVQ